MVHIAVDIMGGDFCPNSNLEGAYDALQADKDIFLLLAGPEETIREAVGKMIDMISSVTLCRSASAEYPGYPRVHQEALSFEQASHSQTEWRQ